MQQEVDSLIESNQVLERHLQECAKKMDEQQRTNRFLKKAGKRPAGCSRRARTREKYRVRQTGTREASGLGCV
jgi:hypothetical protein